MKKKIIAVISPDAVPLTLTSNAPKFIKEGDTEYPIRDKCCRSTSPGIRAWETAKALASNSDTIVTLFVPDLNFPGLENIDFTDINFEIKKYNYKSSMYDWSEELDRKLKLCDFVFVQGTVGAAFKNCAVLPRNVNLIVDAWVPFPAELPCALLNNHKLKREMSYTRSMHYYDDLLKRANCILYANDRQRYFYEGYLFSLGKLSWKAFKFSPLLKVPYGVASHDSIHRTDSTHKLKLLFWGSIYPWQSVEPLFDAVSKNPNIELDFAGTKHPRYHRLYDTVFKDYFTNIDQYPNIRVSTEYVENKKELFSQYDFAVNIGQSFIEERYSHRVRSLESMSHNLRVIMNMGNVLTEGEYSQYYPLAIGVDVNNLPEELENIRLTKKSTSAPMEVFNKFKNDMNWSTVMQPVLDYVEQFSGEVNINAAE